MPIMETPAMVKETLRRIQHLINIPKVDNKRAFHTPYDAFVHNHMGDLNVIVRDALAVPAGVSVDSLRQEGLLPSAWKEFPIAFRETEKTWFALQWPFQLEHMRIIDNENDLFGFDLVNLKLDNATQPNTHVKLVQPATITNGKYWNDIKDIDDVTIASIIQYQYGNYRRPGTSEKY